MIAKEKILKKAKEIRDTRFEIKPIISVPNVDTKHNGLTFGCTGVEFPATILYIDMRGSTQILHKHNRSVVAKIHMTYYNTVIQIVKDHNGSVRSFNGDSLLVFFYGNDVATVRSAVRCAFRIRYALTDIVNECLVNYEDIDFGIGLDCGDVIATKVGVGDGIDDNKDIFWVSEAVNKSARISNECSSPMHIGISASIYDKLDDSLRQYKETKQSNFGPFTQTNDAWYRVWMHGKDYQEYIYKSSCIIKID